MIEKCVIPELHLVQGPVNHLIWKGIVPIIGEEKVLLWTKKFGFIPKEYHGKIFEGNACRRLLKEADALLDYEICKDVGPLPLVPFVSALKAMDKVVECCFSTKKVGENLDDHIEKFKLAYKSTGVSETLKVHVIMEHLKNCLSYLDGRGLGLWSEQAGESVHREFLKFWDKYKINLLEDSSYAERLKRAVVEFSSLHI